MVISSHETAENVEDPRVRVPIPCSFKCPITCEVMVDPVQTNDGHVYDRKSIAQWFGRGHQTSPMTGLRVQNLILTSLEPLRRAIEDYMREISPHLAYHELQRVSLQKALEELEAERYVQREASNLNDKQKRAWKKMLFTAAKNGDAYVIRGIYEAEAHGAIDILTQQSFPLFLAAIKNGNRDVLDALVEVGASLDKKDLDGSTLMHYAVRHDDVSIIEVLYRLGVPLDSMSDFGTPLWTAAYYGKTQAVHVLQDCGVQTAQSRHPFGINALQVAARREGNTEVIKDLWNSGVPAYGNVDFSINAVTTAAYYGHVENLETLLTLMASHDSSLPKASMFWPFDAVWGGNASAVLTLLHDFHIPVDTADSNFEVFSGRWGVEFFQEVIKIGEEYRKLNYFSPTPGEMALQLIDQRTLKIVNQLSEAWKAIGTYGCEGQTAMHWAAIFGNCDAIQTLKKFKVSMTAEDTAGCTPAHFAALMGHVRVLEFFNSFGVTFITVDYCGLTPLDYATRMGHHAAVSYLRTLEE